MLSQAWNYVLDFQFRLAPLRKGGRKVIVFLRKADTLKGRFRGVYSNKNLNTSKHA